MFLRLNPDLLHQFNYTDMRDTHAPAYISGCQALANIGKQDFFPGIKTVILDTLR